MKVADFTGDGQKHVAGFELVRSLGAKLPDVKDASARHSVALGKSSTIR
jgi:hypothetical protein